MRGKTEYKDMADVRKTVLALGYFDALHLGHRRLLERAQALADKLGASLTVCTFDDDFYTNLGLENKEIFTFFERERILKLFSTGSFRVFPTTKDFLNKDSMEFLDYLAADKPAAVVAGADYTFGRNAAGNAVLLKSYMESRNIDCEIIELLTLDGQKISSTLIKQYMSQGDIAKVNSLLGFEYFLSGKIQTGRREGRKIGIPTANMDISSRKYPPKAGVYLSKIEIDGAFHKGLTNIGEHPTFDDMHFNLETHILDFSGDIYGKAAVLYPLEYMRETIKFENKALLTRQIEKDIGYAKGVFL